MIKIRFGKENGPVDTGIYGQFIEHILDCIDGGICDPESPFADEAGIRLDVLEKLKALAPSVLRFPGGTVMCQYHWEDAVGPGESRIRRKNLIWGGELDPAFGTAEFISLCRRLGAEPMICVNMASGTPEEAGNWVEYCNGTGNTHYANLRRSHGYEAPFGVKYWCIGNESYAEPDIGIHHDVKLYIRDATEFIKFMKLTDRTIRTVIVGCGDPQWDTAVLDALHPMADYLSFHHYSGEGGMGLYGPFVGEKHLTESLDRLSGLLASYPERVTQFNPWYRFPPRAGRLQLALDEWNIWDFVPDETYGLKQIYNWRDALWTASVLTQLISRPEIGIANLAQSVNVLAPVVAGKEEAWLQTIAYPWLLYRQAMLGTRLPVYAEAVRIGGTELEALRLTAVRREDGSICLAAVNRDFEREYILELPGDGIRGTQTVLTGDSPYAVCSAEHCCVRTSEKKVAGRTLLLPPGSVSLIQLDKDGLSVQEAE